MTTPVDNLASEPLPDFLVALQGDPWIELRWKKALVTKLREQATRSDGGGEFSASGGGRFAYRLNAQQRIRNAIRAPQAVVKIVRGGGAGSRSDLFAQLAYLSRDGELALDEYEPDGNSFDLQGKSEIKNLSHAWALRWDEAESLDGRAARSKAKAYHLIVSFPEGTDEGKAHEAADTFADRFLTSGEFGDRWGHIRAWHTDRAHPHMHIVIDRRGESGRMMQINPARDISPARLRGLQVDAAAEHGLLLNDTPRVSRGLRGQGLSSPEWRAEQRGERIGRNPHRLAYEKLTSSFADEIFRHEAVELRQLARTLELGSSLTPETNHHHQQQRFIAALDGAAAALEQGKDLESMEPQTPVDDRITLEALSAMSVDDLAETMRNAVKEAEEIAPQLADEAQRARLEVETGRIRQLYAPYVPEFEAALEQTERENSLSAVIDSRLGADQERERAPFELDHDAYDNDLAPEPERPSPVQTLSDADARVVDAYAARGMNGERALARIKGGLEATQETRSYWHDQEIRERMRAGDIPRSVAEREIAELHGYAVGTYRSASRAIERGISLDATEAQTPVDRFVDRSREIDDRFDHSAARSQDKEAEIDLTPDEPLVYVEPVVPSSPADAEPDQDEPDNQSHEHSKERDETTELEPQEKPSHEEFMRRIEEQERELLKEDAKRNRERGIDRTQDIDDGYGL